MCKDNFSFHILLPYPQSYAEFHGKALPRLSSLLIPEISSPSRPTRDLRGAYTFTRRTLPTDCTAKTYTYRTPTSWQNALSQQTIRHGNLHQPQPQHLRRQHHPPALHTLRPLPHRAHEIAHCTAIKKARLQKSAPFLSSRP